MKRLFQIVGLVLAFGWLPMTQHCRIEAMGITLVRCQHAGNADCDCNSRDGCSTVENGGYKASVVKMAVVEPKLFVPVFFVELPAALTVDIIKSEIAPQEHIRPLNWVPNWRFVRRAAPPSRAPSVSIA